MIQEIVQETSGLKIDLGQLEQNLDQKIEYVMGNIRKETNEKK